MSFWRLLYTYRLDLCDSTGNPIGSQFGPFTGSQNITVFSPASSDLTTAATNAGTDMGNQLGPLGGTLNLPNPSD